MSQNEKVEQHIREAFENNLTELNLSYSNLYKLSSEIRELKNLTKLNLSYNHLSKLPSEIGEHKYLTELDLSYNYLSKLPSEIGELSNLKELNLSYNHLSKLPSEIGELKYLEELDLSHNMLSRLPPQIGKLKYLKKLRLSCNQLTELPKEIGELKNLEEPDLSENPLIIPSPEIASIETTAISTYLIQSRKAAQYTEAKLILVGEGKVGKTCLVNRLIYDKFVEDKITEGISISEWIISTQDSDSSKIKLNIWDFGGQDIYQATHQFFLTTTHSVYLLVWNANKTKNYDTVLYFLHMIEAFGGNSPVILVMSKMNEMDDDRDLNYLKSKFPQIAGYLKIDSKDGKGIPELKYKIIETASNLPLVKVSWIDSWYRVRDKLEKLREILNWIPYDVFYYICISEGLIDKNINILDKHLHELGVALHFKDRIALKNIVILKPEWVIDAFYKILSAKSVLHGEGLLSYDELSQIWDVKTYPSHIHSQLMELMIKFELVYELPDKSYLVPELLPQNTPDNFDWDYTDNLCFYYCYDSFLPPGIIPRFIVRMHQDLEKNENDMHICWREGAVLKLQNSHALINIKSDKRQIEIRIKGGKKSEALGVICDQFDHINFFMKKISVSKEVPCNCSETCPQTYIYDKLLSAEKRNEMTIQCHESYRSISVPLLLDCYKSREEISGNLIEYDVFVCHSSQDKQFIAKLIKVFKNEGLTFWIDEEQIKFGDIITQKIEEGLKKSKYIIPCLSKNLIISGWTRAEYSSILTREFSGKSKRVVIPLKLDNCEDDDIPDLLYNKKRVTYSNKPEFKEFIQFLKKQKAGCYL